MSSPEPVTDDEVNDYLMAFALRFDGERYLGSREDGEAIVVWMRQLVETLELAPDDNLNHAAFFHLQRFLGKWGGEMLSIESREHLAYRFLFLHLYRAKVPARFALKAGTVGTAPIDPDRIELVAARVRAQLIALTLKHGDPICPEARRLMPKAKPRADG